MERVSAKGTRSHTAFETNIKTHEKTLAIAPRERSSTPTLFTSIYRRLDLIRAHVHEFERKTRRRLVSQTPTRAEIEHGAARGFYKRVVSDRVLRHRRGVRSVRGRDEVVGRVIDGPALHRFAHENALRAVRVGHDRWLGMASVVRARVERVGGRTLRRDKADAIGRRRHFIQRIL